MIADTPGLHEAVRDRFAHVDACPITGPRVFFENAGGALTLKSVVDTSAVYAAIPDNQGRDNPASAHLMTVIETAIADARVFFNAPDGQIFVGESGTEVIYRLIRTALVGSQPGGIALGSTLEHPATRSAMAHWAEVTDRPHNLVPHNDATGTVDAAAYAHHITPDVRVATIIHTSPVTGMGVDVPAVVAAIRAKSPDCFIIVDGIQHASHGQIDIQGSGIDGYAVSPYKVFSRHGYGIGWASDRLTALPHETLRGGPETNWNLGTRDTGAYATFSDVVAYFDWLGGEVSAETDRRARIEAAGRAIHEQETALTNAMLHGVGNLAGLGDMLGVQIVGGLVNPAREGLVSLWVDHIESGDLVAALRDRGVRVHIRKADHYSGNILEPLGRPDCVRVSLCHYNSMDEVRVFLAAMHQIVGETDS